MGNIYITSDLHFGHLNNLTYSPRRAILANEWCQSVDHVYPTQIDAHDEWLINKWNSKVTKYDTVYFLGDFSFRSRSDTESILKRLNGHKFLIRGNHDTPLNGLENYFVWVGALKEIKIRADVYDNIPESFNCVLCHYPLLTWRTRSRGGIMLHGHCHGALDEYNLKSGELRMDVGIDGRLASYEILSIQDVYMFAKKISQGKTFLDYISDKIKSSDMFDC